MGMRLSDQDVEEMMEEADSEGTGQVTFKKSKKSDYTYIIEQQLLTVQVNYEEFVSVMMSHKWNKSLYGYFQSSILIVQSLTCALYISYTKV